MTTPTAQSAIDAIGDSLLALNVLREGQAPTAELQAQGIRRLNQMMALWEADGIRLGYVPVGAANQKLTVPDGAILGIVASLAKDWATSLGASVSPELLDMYERGMAVIHKITAQEIIAASELQPAADQCGGFNIETGD